MRQKFIKGRLYQGDNGKGEIIVYCIGRGNNNFLHGRIVSAPPSYNETGYGYESFNFIGENYTPYNGPVTEEMELLMTKAKVGEIYVWGNREILCTSVSPSGESFSGEILNDVYFSTYKIGELVYDIDICRYVTKGVLDRKRKCLIEPELKVLL